MPLPPTFSRLKKGAVFLSSGSFSRLGFCPFCWLLRGSSHHPIIRGGRPPIYKPWMATTPGVGDLRTNKNHSCCNYFKEVLQIRDGSTMAWQDSKAPQTPKLATLESAMSMAPRRCFAPPSKFLVDDTPLEEHTTLLGLLLPFFFWGRVCCIVLWLLFCWGVVI